ncbi:replication protein [Methylogaea oryzae]|uniref:Bacteriophage lambda Replication protein O N-terminal domain-containing protein n=1 Tax=Methylogaea oryzae TaxID=1295382 RepID=A0A8D4VLN4_9GAMM|nr:replication protein [Methylogaea oryzae]BBL69817.1 hypothetical protein MoryE10_04230 [Methylogaea oryzae]
MASPQTEDGYIRIANELLDAILMFPFSKRQLKVVLALIRKIYGFNKKADDLASSQLSTLTGLNDAHCRGTVRRMIQAGELRTVKVRRLVRVPAESVRADVAKHMQPAHDDERVGQAVHEQEKGACQNARNNGTTMESSKGRTRHTGGPPLSTDAASQLGALLAFDATKTRARSEQKPSAPAGS